MPGLGSGTAGGGSASVVQLKKLMEEVEEIRKEREQLENEFKNKSFDMGK